MFILAAAIFALGLLPFVFARARTGRPSTRFVALWIAAALAGAWLIRWAPAEASFPSDGRPLEVVPAEFTSSDACQSCHPSEYATWHSSYHRTMTQLATTEAVRGDFNDVRLRVGNRPYHLERREDGFFVNGRRVLMTTGSHHMQAYWVSENRGRLVSLVQLVYLFDERRWVPRQDVFLQPPGLPPRTDAWNDNCIECHSTHGRPRLARGVDTQVTEFGIACEACHGPARAHVEANRSPRRRYALHFDGDAPDPTIVQPERLSARLASHVCARCHSISYHTKDQEDAYFDGDGDTFRAGDDLRRTADILLGPDDPNTPRDPPPEPQPLLRDSMFWPDGVSRGSGREFSAMQHSACFGTGESADNVSCLSCHEMHQKADDARPVEEWANDQLKRGMDGDRACLQCHESELGQDLTRHTRHASGSSGSRCQNCHMPYQTFGLLKAIRSHYVANPSVANSLETGRPNACNLCHLDRSLGWTADRLHEGWGVETPALASEDRDVSAAVRWMLAGDARQRALLAWHAGWEPAQQASGDEWIAPFMAPLLSDPYSVVRLVSSRSLRTLPGFEDFEVDPFGSPAQLDEASRRAWHASSASGKRRVDPALLMRAEGIDQPTFFELLNRRDDRPVAIME